MELFKFEGMQKSKDIADYKPLEARTILEVDIEKGNVLINRLDRLSDRFGVIDNKTKED